MFEQQTQHIDLTLPRGWNQCTTEQLELIAACIIKHTLEQNRYHPFDWLEVKAELFFLLTEVEVVSEENDPVDGDPEYQHHAYICRKGGTEFPIYIWQVYSFIEQHLAWIDDPKAKPLIIFPYKQLLSEWRLSRRFPFVKKHWLAPGELLQDFSWREYRFLQDYMELYVSLQNQMAKLQQQGASDKDRLADLARQMLDARNKFLAVLFKAEGKLSARPKDACKARIINSQFSIINDIRWQVILFWWSGMMHYLQQQFPHCFKQSKSKSTKRPPLPIELYRNIITTVQKESNGLTEDEVNAQTFYIVLEHLERLAKQAEEMEKLNRKH